MRFFFEIQQKNRLNTPTVVHVSREEIPGRKNLRNAGFVIDIKVMFG